jgi:hypothetical protein
MRASFVGIGAQKCASTWLYGALAQLEGVFVSDPKEVDFFSAHFNQGYEWYHRHFPTGGAGALYGEVSPSYLIHPDAPSRIQGYNPEMRVLVTFRDPVERAYSNHLHEVRAGHITGGNLVFEAALDNNPLYLDQGRYARHLARWFEAFPAGQIHVTFQEQVKHDSRAQTERLAKFLERAMPRDYLQRRSNESIDYRNRAIGKSLWRVGESLRRAGFGHLVEEAKKLPVVREMRKANQRDLRSAVAPMKPETEARLIDLYRPEVARLEEILDTTVPWPRFRPN